MNKKLANVLNFIVIFLVGVVLCRNGICHTTGTFWILALLVGINNLLIGEIAKKK